VGSKINFISLSIDRSVSLLSLFVVSLKKVARLDFLESILSYFERLLRRY